MQIFTKPIAIGIKSIVFMVLILFSFSFFWPGHANWLDQTRLSFQAPLIHYICNIPSLQYNDDQSNHAIVSIPVHIETGSIIFTSHKHYLAANFIPGYWKHVAIFLGSKEQVNQFFTKDPGNLFLINSYFENGDEILVLEASTSGVTINNLKQPDDNYNDSVLNLASVNLQLNLSQTSKFINHALKQIGKAYDFDLQSEDSSMFYCSELIYNSLKHIGIECTLDGKICGRDYISPQSLAKQLMTKNL